MSSTEDPDDYIVQLHPMTWRDLLGLDDFQTGEPVDSRERTPSQSRTNQPAINDTFSSSEVFMTIVTLFFASVIAGVAYLCLRPPMSDLLSDLYGFCLCCVVGILMDLVLEGLLSWGFAS